MRKALRSVPRTTVLPPVVVTQDPASGATRSPGADVLSVRYPGPNPGRAVARALLTIEPMLVEVVFQYRTLLGKCDLGVGLDWDEIEQLTSIESAFAPTEDDRRMKNGRRFRREQIKLTALLRGDQINDRVEITELGPGGVVVRNAPFIAADEQLEIQLDLGDQSFRFRARGVWLRDDGDDYKVGLAFIGMPVCLNKTAISRHEADVVDEISAAA